jgi:hypothetical protein
MFILSFTSRGEYSLLFRKLEGQTENFTPQGTTSPLGDNFALGAKLRMGLCSL